MNVRIPLVLEHEQVTNRVHIQNVLLSYIVHSGMWDSFFAPRVHRDVCAGSCDQGGIEKKNWRMYRTVTNIIYSPRVHRF